MIRARTTFNGSKIRRKARDGSITSIRHGAAAIRLTARRSIRRSKQPAAPGKPPHTRRGRLKTSILYHADNTRGHAVIGPAYSRIRKIGSVHEFGKSEPAKFREPNWKLRIGGHGPLGRTSEGIYLFGKLKTSRQVAEARRLAPGARRYYLQRFRERQHRDYPERPLMGPALRKIAPRLPRMWAGAVRA